MLLARRWPRVPLGNRTSDPHREEDADKQHRMSDRRNEFSRSSNRSRGVQVYFCDSQSPWQRGTNENTNLLLRQYFPKRTDLSGYSQAQLDRVALRLNQRPRKTLGFQTPASKLQASVASTV